MAVSVQNAAIEIRRKKLIQRCILRHTLNSRRILEIVLNGLFDELFIAQMAALRITKAGEVEIFDRAYDSSQREC